MTIKDIIENGGDDFSSCDASVYGQQIIAAAGRFNVENWEEEQGNQRGVSFQLLRSVAYDTPLGRLYWQGKVSPQRRHAYADAQTIV